MQNSVTQSVSTVKPRDCDGKYAPKFGPAWMKRQAKREAEKAERERRVIAEYSAWAAERGIDPDELKYMFA